MGTPGSERCVSEIRRWDPLHPKMGVLGPQSRRPGSTHTPGQPVGLGCWGSGGLTSVGAIPKASAILA